MPGMSGSTPGHDGARPVLVEVDVGPVVAHGEAASHLVAEVMGRLPGDDLFLAPARPQREAPQRAHPVGRRDAFAQ